MSDTFELISARKQFGGTIAVHGLDLRVEAGSVHSLIGENGAGKSTAAQMLAGVHSVTAGTVAMNGEPVAFSSALDAEERGIALIPQELQLYPALTVVENLYVARRRPRTPWGSFDQREMDARASEALVRLGLDVRPRDLVDDLPYGSRQIVAIARALLSEVRLLIMDEPTAALDEWESQRLLDVVRDLRGEGVAVLYVSHRMNEVIAVSDTVSVMRDGRLISTGPVGGYTRESLVEQMVGRQVNLIARATSYATDEVALRVENLSQPPNFSDISFEVHCGEVLAIAGIVGSGRSEVALAIYGRTSPAAGSVRYGEAAPRRHRTILTSLRDGVGFVPEERQAQGLFLPQDVITNVSILQLRTLRRGGLLRRARERLFSTQAMTRFVFRRALSEKVSSLSGGNQQKVLLARILASAPKVLILDEPTRGIDVGARAEVYSVIDDLAKQGIAIVVVSSDIQEVLLLADRVLVMQNGSLVAELTGADRTELKIGHAALVPAEVHS